MPQQQNAVAPSRYNALGKLCRVAISGYTEERGYLFYCYGLGL